MNFRGYDEWKTDPGEQIAIGEAEGEDCNRYPEPDEDAPRGYKPRRCKGTMRDVDECGVCDTCGAVAE